MPTKSKPPAYCCTKKTLDHGTLATISNIGSACHFRFQVTFHDFFPFLSGDHGVSRLICQIEEGLHLFRVEPGMMIY